ncbi:MAG: efflux RND transporter periplasmic adaptor subunit [Treponema sp.]|jgi:multidrug efflux pump subunit AcrA (membrane-fusion protein)|nr:efflux RND transporter periplasmic adaptor subunit [Treponema sp.]
MIFLKTCGETIAPKRVMSGMVALFIAITLGACNREEAESATVAPVAESVPVFAVNTTTAVQGQISDYIALAGDIVAGSTVDVYSDVAGKVTRVYTTVGSRVSKDAQLVEVDPSRPGMNYIPGVVKAPVAGTIVSLNAQPGQTLSQAIPVARISSSGSSGLEIKVYVAERFVSKISPHLPCEIILDAYPSEVFKGSISEVSPVLDPASRTMEVKINVDNVDNKLKAGMFAKTRIVTEQKSGIVKIPYAALIERFGETYVFTVATDPTDPAFRVARRRVVTKGILVDGVQEIQSGLSPNEEIVVRGQSLLEDGSRINVVERVAPLAATN